MGKSMKDKDWLEELGREIQMKENPFEYALGDTVFSRKYRGTAVVTQRGILEDERGSAIVYFLEGASEDGSVQVGDFHTKLFIEGVSSSG